MREIVLDTETTGLDPKTGDRVVEIGCVELLNKISTGNNFHVYINPQRKMPAEAEAVHGLGDAFLADKPLFAAIAKDFVDFIGDARLVIHNAAFDIGFLNAELARVNLPPLGFERVTDTLLLARRKNPGGSNSLDALCSRYGIDTSKRTKHGALLNSELLADVYLELLGGRQASFGLASETRAERDAFNEARGRILVRETPLQPRLSAVELAAHAEFVATLGEKAIWRLYVDETASATASAGLRPA